jgi:hypothetical protein
MVGVQVRADHVRDGQRVDLQVCQAFEESSSHQRHAVRQTLRFWPQSRIDEGNPPVAADDERTNRQQDSAVTVEEVGPYNAGKLFAEV